MHSFMNGNTYVHKVFNLYVFIFVILQLYDRRRRYLKNEEERGKWSTIDYNYMTDESASETEDVIRQHKLIWRSEGI